MSFSFITKVAKKKNLRVIVFQDRIITWHAKKAPVLEEHLLNLHHHLARLAWLIQECLFSVRK